MKSSDERHSAWLLVIGIIVGVLALTAGPALAALTFSGTQISGDGAVVIDSSSTISIGTSPATGDFFDVATGRLGLGNATNKLSLLTLQPKVAVTLTGTTSANATSTIVGIGTLFLTEVGIGDILTCSGTGAAQMTVMKITDNTHLTLDADFNGDSCGDGTMGQTMTVIHGYQYRDSLGNILGLVNDNGFAFGGNDYSNTNLPTPPSKGAFIGADMVGRSEDDSMLSMNFHGIGDAMGKTGNQGFVIGSDNVSGHDVSNISNLSVNLGTRPGNIGIASALNINYGNFGGTVTTAAAANISCDSSGVTNLTCLLIQDVSGGTNSWAIKTGLGKVEFGDTLQIDTSTFILANSLTPAHSTSTCTTGMFAWDSNFVYECVGTNTWKRAALSSW